jgi:hypothetical protein
MTRIIGMFHVVAVIVTLVAILCVVSLLEFESRPKNDVTPLWVTVGLIASQRYQLPTGRSC